MRGNITNFQNQQCSLFDRKAVFYTLKTFTIISTDFSNKRHQSRMFMGNWEQRYINQILRNVERTFLKPRQTTYSPSSQLSLSYKSDLNECYTSRDNDHKTKKPFIQLDGFSISLWCATFVYGAVSVHLSFTSDNWTDQRKWRGE